MDLAWGQSQALALAEEVEEEEEEWDDWRGLLGRMKRIKVYVVLWEYDRGVKSAEAH